MQIDFQSHFVYPNFFVPWHFVRSGVSNLDPNIHPNPNTNT